MDEKKEPQEEYSFLQETIKKEGLASKKGRRKLYRIMLGGVLFGMCACASFFALKPWAENKFRGNPEEVTIPAEENLPAEEPTEEQTEEPLEDQATQILDGSSYQEMIPKVGAVAGEAGKTIVAVKATVEADPEEITDPESEEEAVRSETGLIIADNGQELLILTTSHIVGDAADLTVSFCDRSEYAAALKKQDRNIGLAVISISKNEISSSTWNSIQIANLGNSRIVCQGDMVVSLGNTFGYAGGQGYGIISSVEYKSQLSDGEYGILATDIATTEKGTGILFNLEGDVIGIVMPSIWENESGLLANAYAISDLKTAIELLSNGASVPYIGVHGTYITEDIAEQQGIPQGLYVNHVDTDSPALAAGIQNGDILVKLGDKEISSLAVYQRALIGRTVGGNAKIKAQRRGANGYVDIDFTVKIGSLE